MHAGQLRFDLTICPETRQTAILLSDPDSTAQAQPVGSRLVFRQPVRSCRRWQLTFCSAVLRGLLPPRHAPGYVRSTSKPERPRLDCVGSYCATAGRRPAVLGILMYLFVHSGSCALAVTDRQPLATLSKQSQVYDLGAVKRFPVLNGGRVPGCGHRRIGEFDGTSQCCFRIRPFWRSQSRSFSAARLSCFFLPLASAISTLTLPRFQYIAVGTSV